VSEWEWDWGHGVVTEGGDRSYLHVVERALLKGHILVRDVDEEVSVARAYAAVAVDDFAGWVGERRRLGHGVLDLVAVAGAIVCRAGHTDRGLIGVQSQQTLSRGISVREVLGKRRTAAPSRRTLHHRGTYTFGFRHGCLLRTVEKNSLGWLDVALMRQSPMTAPERLIRDLCTTRPSNPSSKPQWTLRYIRALSRPVTPISQPLRPRTRLGELQRDGAHRATRSHVSGVQLGDFRVRIRGIRDTREALTV